MKNRLCLAVGIVAVGGALVSCGTTGAGPTVSSDEQVDSQDITLAKVPVLRSTLEGSWGRPRVSVNADGSYRLTYRQGTTLNFVFVDGLVNPPPVPATPPQWSEESFNEKKGEPELIYHSQNWRQTQIMGKSVRWYQNDGGSGADFPAYRTVPFQLTAPDGRTATYRVEVCSTSAEQAGKWIRQVGW